MLIIIKKESPYEPPICAQRTGNKKLLKSSDITTLCEHAAVLLWCYSIRKAVFPVRVVIATVKMLPKKKRKKKKRGHNHQFHNNMQCDTCDR